MPIEYQLPWDGVVLDGPVLAFDTETEWIEGEDSRRIPRIALATASSLTRNIVLSPAQLPAFFAAHPKRHWALHNAAFDFWAMQAMYPDAEWLWDAVHESRWHCTMLLDQLIRIASNLPSYNRNLGEVARDYCGLEVDKESSYRYRFHELIGRESEWPDLDPGFFQYAAGDTAATLRVYLKQVEKAEQLDELAGLKPYREKLWPVFGVLTEQIQIKSSIALSLASRIGFAVDQTDAKRVEEKLVAEIDEHTKWLSSHYPQLFRYEGSGWARRPVRVSRKKKGKEKTVSRAPRWNNKELRLLLESLNPDAPRTQGTNTYPEGQVVTALDVWRELLPNEPFVEHWGKCVDASKLLQFVEKLQAEKPVTGLFDTDAEREEMKNRPQYTTHVRARYNTLVVTGRTSSQDPNIQQMPRQAWFRTMFRADPGHVLIVADYSAIELVTLAAVCLKRFGRSRLADVFHLGIDPHAFTAALMSGLATADTDPNEVVRRWDEYAKKDKAGAKLARQAAKPVNFGVPGGLSDVKLASYGKLNYGVDIPLEKWTEFRTRLIEEVYPELKLYLTDDPLRTLSVSLNSTREKLIAAFGLDAGAIPEWFGPWVKKIIAGRCYKRDGTPYAEESVQRVWKALAQAAGPNCPDRYKHAFTHGTGSEELADMIFATRVCTLTGRVRDGVSFTESRNTPFQALAADGGKMALWELCRRRHQIAAFIHDEIVGHVPADRAKVVAEEFREVMTTEMSKAIQCGIPVKVSIEISERWEKP